MKRPFSEQVSEFRGILGATLRIALTNTAMLGAILGEARILELSLVYWGGPRAPEAHAFRGFARFRDI